MKIPHIITLLLLFVSSQVLAQNAAIHANNITKNEVESHVRFLASDELEGRKAGYRGNDLAARYIAEQFRRNGVSTVPGHDSYYQPFSLEEITPAETVDFTLMESQVAYMKDMIMLNGGKFNYDGEVVFVKYGVSKADYEGADVEGKIVAVQVGSPTEQSPQAVFNLIKQKQVLAEEMGAIGMVELYNLRVPWTAMAGYLGGGRMQLASNKKAALPTFWVNDTGNTYLKKLTNAESANIKVETEGGKITERTTQNIVGFIEGTDPKLKDEYVMMTAHFDHVGVGKEGAPNVTEEDMVFNGARDNAIGTTAILSASRILAANPPKRSILLIAFTAEELGLIGSRYYADNPWLPLNKCIFNLNIDNGGYNDTSIVTVIGLERTGAKEQMEMATKAFGLSVIDDPAPEQGLFDRSDNVNFAVKGIPSPTFSLGFTSFDKEILKYYHQITDEAESVDFDYVLKYCQSYTYAAELIANLRKQPKWEKGDKYEEAYKKLYKD